MYLAFTFLVLSYTCDVPGAAFPPVPALARRWSADHRFTRGADLGRPRAPGGRQVPLVFSAWDSATRNAATAVGAWRPLHFYGAAGSSVRQSADRTVRDLGPALGNPRAIPSPSTQLKGSRMPGTMPSRHGE